MRIKLCTKCKRELPYESFGTLSRSKDGLRNHCKECRNAENNLYSSQNVRRVKEWRKKNPEKLKEHMDTWNSGEGKREAHNRWREKNPEHDHVYYEANKEKLIAQSRIYAENNPDITKEYQLKSHLKIQFSLTVEEYQQMLDKQGGVCAICKQEETAKSQKTVKRLSVDHDHTTGKIRGLLCDRCNRGLGFFKDDSERLKEAINYVEKYS